MDIESPRSLPATDTRKRILDVALEVLGQNPDAGMGEIAVAAGVVRRTVYGHFPTRADLVRTLAQQAVEEIVAVLREVNSNQAPADAVWVAFIARLWPLARRYRVIVVLRRGEYGAEIHALLGPVDETLAGLVKRGQEGEAFGRHLPADALSQIAFSSVFAIADNDTADGLIDARAATVTSLLIFGVTEARANELLSSVADLEAVTR